MNGKKRAWRWAGWGLLGVLGLVLFFRHLNPGFWNEPAPQDFRVYIEAVRLVGEGLTPYRPDVFLTYKYSPGLLPLFALLPADPMTAWLWTKAIYVLAWALAIGVTVRACGPRDLALLLAGLLLSWKGMIESLDFGQFEPVLLFCTLTAAVGWKRWPVAAAFLLGSLPWFKLPWGLLLVPMLLVAHRQGKLRQTLLGAGAAGVFWGALLPGAYLGAGRLIDFYGDWWRTLRTQPQTLWDEHANQSLIATLERITGSLAWARALSGLVLATLGAGLARVTWRAAGRQEELRWITAWTLLLLLANPLSWRWGSLVLVTVPWVMRDFDWRRFRPAPTPAFAGLCLGALLVLSQQNPVVRALGFEHWTAFHAYGAVTALWALLLAWVATAKDQKKETAAWNPESA